MSFLSCLVVNLVFQLAIGRKISLHFSSHFLHSVHDIGTLILSVAFQRFSIKCKTNVEKIGKMLFYRRTSGLFSLQNFSIP